MIFTVLLLAVETIEGVVSAAPRYPVHSVAGTAGTDVDPAAGGEGDGLYLGPRHSMALMDKGNVRSFPFSSRMTTSMNWQVGTGR